MHRNGDANAEEPPLPSCRHSAKSPGMPILGCYRAHGRSRRPSAAAVASTAGSAGSRRHAHTRGARPRRCCRRRLCRRPVGLGSLAAPLFDFFCGPGGWRSALSRSAEHCASRPPPPLLPRLLYRPLIRGIADTFRRGRGRGRVCFSRPGSGGGLCEWRGQGRNSRTRGPGRGRGRSVTFRRPYL
eukprot:358262-Chlamydomonas_euryale.AAC.4